MKQDKIMAGQKQRIIRRFEREARKELKEYDLREKFLDNIEFTLKEIKDIINFQEYSCGHEGKPIILDDNELSISAFFEWNKTVGREGNKLQCWECWCDDGNNPKN